MKRSIVFTAAVFVIVAMLAAPSFAQTPAPKVTINGLVDFVTTWHVNMGAGTASPGATTLDTTDPREKGWYSRERGVFTITGEIGRAKGVWAIELDFSNGAGNFGANANTGFLNVMGPSANGTTSPFNLDTDTKGAVETKWLYLETPITGPGSLLPFIPVNTIARMGGQPAVGHDYKPGVLLTGDIPGITLLTTWAPNVRSTVTYVQIGEALDRGIALHQKDDFAILASLEAEPFKGLTVKPTFAYAFYNGGNCGLTNLGTFGYGGYSPTTNCPSTIATPGAALPSVASTPGGVGHDIERYYFGGDVRWTMGPFSLQPTFLYLWGRQEVPFRAPAGTNPYVNNVPIRAFLADTVAGFRTGPLLIEVRGMYNPGVGANNDVQNGGGGTIRTFQGINTGYSYMSGWTEIWKGDIDYNLSLSTGRPAIEMRNSPSFDKYGRIFAGLAVDYSLTPALSMRALTNVSWTDTAVDTKGTGANATGITPSTNPFSRGKERYLGNEWIVGLTYRFAPNIVFDLVGATLITGPALDIQRSATSDRGPCSTDGVPTCQSRNVYKATARVRLTF
jgi:hypothetical protein